MIARNFVHPSFYQDSVTLMRLTHVMEGLPGVRRAAAMMGTPANRALLAEAGLLAAEGAAAHPTDLVVAVLADDEPAAGAARDTALAALQRARAETSGTARRPRTVRAALQTLPEANLALISVPGEYAGPEAARCLRHGLHVMLFSDNVPIETEVRLKRQALERERLLMGPDCGTAILEGVPLGFANAVPRGRIGLAAASGTGLQEVTCRIAAQGEGVSQAIGLGGRDLTDAVGGLMADLALSWLAEDPATEVIGLLGKPPGPAVASRIAERLATLDKPCVVYFAGAPNHHELGTAAATLEDAGSALVALARGQTPRPITFTQPRKEIAQMVEAASARMASGQRHVRGVYAGGTLAWEALTILRGHLGASVPDTVGAGHGHRVVDLGDDRFTRGRPHPMIDGTLRREWIAREAEDPTIAVLLLDVVLGYGAHPDPAGELLPAIANATRTAAGAGRSLPIVASVCGTDADPQSRAVQVRALTAAGVRVMPSNAQAARLAAEIAARRTDRDTERPGH